MSIREVLSFFYPDPKARLGEIVVDAFVHETHSFSSEITEHPIESGGVITDHVYNLPFCLSIEGIISNTPMNLVGLTAFDSAKRYLEGDRNDFALMAFEKIEEIFTKRLSISIATSIKTYDQMVLESLKVERGGGSAASFQFQCTAKQIRFVNQKMIKVPKPKTSRAKPKEKKGLQETKPIPQEKMEAIKNSSLMKGALESVVNLFRK
jgi:hypothetical protein